MTFEFNRNIQQIETIITSVMYDTVKHKYEIVVLGLDEGGLNYTIQGKAWIKDKELKELLDSGGLESEHQLVGRKLKLVADSVQSDEMKQRKQERLDKELDDYEEF